jgi:hypothetical protein
MTETTDESAAAGEAKPFYITVITDPEAIREAGRLIGLQEELRTRRAAVREYAAKHECDLDMILKAMRVITQMTVAQQRTGTDKYAQAAAALEAATKDYIEAFNAPDEDDV